MKRVVLCTICLLLIISGCGFPGPFMNEPTEKFYTIPPRIEKELEIPITQEIKLDREMRLDRKKGVDWKLGGDKVSKEAKERLRLLAETNPIKIIEVGESAGYSYVTPGIPYELTKEGRRQSHLTELEKLHQWVQDGLASGAVHSVNVEYNEIRMDPISWSLVPIESKRIIIRCFSRYFDLKSSTGRVTIRSKYSDEKLASYSVWTGIKIYK